MAASATIDITTIIQPAVDTTSGSKAVAVDASAGFASALDNANKNYSANTSPVTNTNIKTTNNKTVQTQTTAPQTGNTEAKSNTTDTTQKAAQSDNNIQQTDSKIQDNPKNTQQPVEAKTNPDSDKNADSSNAQITPQATQQPTQQVTQQQPEQQATQPVIQQSAQEVIAQQDLQQTTPQEAPQPAQTTSQPEATKETTEAKNTKEPQKTDEAPDINTATVTIENIVQNIPNVIQAEVASAVADTVQQPANPQTDAVQTVSAQTQPTQENVNVDLTNLTGNSAKLANAIVNNKQVQTQTQQALSNIKINPQDAQQLQAQAPQTQSQQAQTQAVETTSTQAQAAPIIEAVENVIATDDNVVKALTNDKKDIENSLSKTVLTQEIISKTNAKITNVETDTSNQNSNNLNQNAQEQVVKLAIENNSANNKVQNIVPESVKEIQKPTLEVENNTIAIPQAVQQTNSVQTFNNIQTQNQAPKELSKTDVFSQIETQLNAKPLQTGETTKVSIILQPENLGKITLELVNSKEGLTAKMTTDNEQVKELLSKHLDNLKDTMSNQGVNVGNITVKVDETQKQSNEQSNFNNWQAKQGSQEFSNNAQSQNENESQNEFNYGEKTYNSTATDAEEDMNVESEAITEKNVENTVSISVGSGKVDYKI